MALCFFRTMLLYLVLIFSVRLMGKRQIGEMEPLEFVVTMLLANLAAIPMQDGAIPLYSGLVPILTILGGELDNLPEVAFNMVGSVDEVRDKARDMGVI